MPGCAVRPAGARPIGPVRIGLGNRAKLLTSMFLRRFGKAAAALGVSVALSLAAISCSNGPGPTGPQPGSVTVTAVSPATGSSFGGTAVTITGTGFSAGATVQIGAAAATNITVVSSTTITATTAANAAGVADVRVTSGGAAGSLAGAFTFVTPTGTNAAPTVGAIAVTPPRDNQPSSLATIGDRVTLTATINDAETPLADLTIEWSALPNIGAFSGSGASVQWTAPASTSSPQSVVLMLTVLERYLEADASGAPVQREHRVQRTTTVRVHDTVKEVTEMATDFLTLFSNSSLGPEAVLHNFSQTCDGGDGYEQEYGDVVTSRDTRVILTHEISAPTKFEWGFGEDRICTGTNKTTAGDVCVTIPVTWTEKLIGSDDIDTVSGLDFVSAVYEETRWRLCHSKWEGFSTITGKPVVLDVTDRRGIIKGPIQK